MKDVLTFIMAGGKGKRLFPLTRDRAKPAVPFGGVYRIIDFTLSNCLNSGLRKIHVLTQYKSMSLERHLHMGWQIFNAEVNEYIDMVPAQQRIDEHWYKGTADSIYQNIYSIDMRTPKDTLILSGDHIYKMNYAPMIRFHREVDADVTIAIVEMDIEKASQLGVVEVNRKSRVIGFQEKPTEKIKTVPGNKKKIYVSMGVYIFKTDALRAALIDDAKDKSSEHDFGKNIIPSMLKNKKTYAYNFVDENKGGPNYWRDIGTIDAYYEANMDLVRVVPIFNLYDKAWPIRTYQEQFPPGKTVFAGTDEYNRMGLALDSLVSNGCIISGGKVQSSVLSPNVRINSFSEVYDSILMEGVNVGRHAKIRRAIIDKDVEIPADAEIGYNQERDRKNFHVTDSGVVVVAKKTHIKL